MDLAPGIYTITAALHTEASHIECCYNWKDNVASFQVAGIRGVPFAGVVRLHVLLNLKAIDVC